MSQYGYDIGATGASALFAEPPALAGGGLTSSLPPGGGGEGGGQIWVDLNCSNQLQTRYLRGDDISELFARINSAGTAAWYLPDHLGSIRNLIDNTGILIDTIAYDAYGNVTNETSPSNGDRFKWAELQNDAATGLNFAKARPEDPATGRWLEQDPIRFRAGDNNLYRYAFNEPTTRVDRSGLESILGPCETSMTSFTDSTGQITICWRFINFPMGGFLGGLFSFGTWTGLPLLNSLPSWLGGTRTPDYASLRAQYFDPEFRKGWQESMKQIAKLYEYAMYSYLLIGMTVGGGNAPIMRAFFAGQRLLPTQANIAALRWYLQIARRILAKYESIGYTGSGVATQMQRIQQILQQLAACGVGE